MSLKKRMHSSHVLGLLVIVGGRFKAIVDQLIAASQRKRLGEKQITPQGRLESTNDIPGVRASASPLGSNGVIVRFCGDNTECAMLYVKQALASLSDVLGLEPYQENR